MSTHTDIIDATLDDEEFNTLVANMDKLVPPIEGKGIDFTKIQGNYQKRTAKAIILHLTLTHRNSVEEIAAALEVSPTTVHRYLGEALRDTLVMEDVELLRRFEDMKLNEQAKVCWDQFYRSCEDAVTGHETTDEDGNVTTKTTRTGQSGNPAYQKMLLEIYKCRDKLWGLSQPTRVEVDKTDRKLVISEVIVKTPEDVQAARIAGYLK